MNKEKERIKLQEQEKASAQRTEQTKKEIVDGVKQFQSLMGQQDFLLRSLYVKSKDVGKSSGSTDVLYAIILLFEEFCVFLPKNSRKTTL